MPVDMPELFAILQEYADANYPDHGVVELVIYQPHGRPSRLALPPRLPSLRARVRAEPEESGSMTDCILEAVAGYDGAEPLTGEKLAALAGYEYVGRFRAELARLVKDGRLVNGRPGYSLPEN